MQRLQAVHKHFGSLIRQMRQTGTQSFGDATRCGSVETTETWLLKIGNPNIILHL